MTSPNSPGSAAGAEVGAVVPVVRLRHWKNRPARRGNADNKQHSQRQRKREEGNTKRGKGKAERARCQCGCLLPRRRVRLERLLEPLEP